MSLRSLLLEVAHVAYCDAEAIQGRYDYPRKSLTPEMHNEADRLLVLSRRIAYRANCIPEDDDGT